MASLPTAQALGRKRRADALARPIAASLALPEAHVGVIAQSHERCTALGLSRIERPDYAPLGRPDLGVARERNRRLHSHAAPVMEMLFDQIVGTESMVVLCDTTGTIIHSIGDDDFLSRASKVALQPGVNWSEQAKGTNAIGTALIEEQPTLVHADEHFMHANHFLTCSATPILDPRGSVLGVLDVTGDHRSYHQHTMALVKMSARMIENHWLSDDHRNAMRLHFHARPEFIDTLMEGILAVSPAGRIVGANRSALEQLGLSGATLRMHSLASLFGTTVGALVDRFRSPLATPMPVHSANGRSLHIHARFSWAAWGSVPDHAPQPAPMADAAPAAAPAPVPAAPGLEALLTGDPQLDAVVSKVRRVLDRHIPILVCGETGTGKEMLARAIHQDSARSRLPFVAVNCAAAAPALFGAELFAQAAGGGTLWLDEIGELPLPLQARLLHLLPQVPALVCTTQRGLREMVEAGTFREDLYHRLNGLSVKLPPLRERSDLAALVHRLLDAAAAGSRHPLAPEVLDLFERHPWPGNLRQLGNVLRTAAALAGAGCLITRAQLPDEFLEDAGPRAHGDAVAPSLQALELQAIREALDAAAGNITLAAKRLGVSRNTIYRKLRWSPPTPASPA
jgi:transcriptional regulator of acetoin/glycerol metabolism